MKLPLKFLHFVAKQLPCKQIFAKEDIPYLERFYIGEFNGYTYYLHRMLGPDESRDLHNHPWKLCGSLILYGGYIERRLTFGFQKRRIEYIPNGLIDVVRGFYYYNAVSKFNTLSEYTWHTIVEIQEPETWTLFWHTDWYRSWGFLTAEGYKVNKEKIDVTAKSKWWKDAKKGKEIMYGIERNQKENHNGKA